MVFDFLSDNFLMVLYLKISAYGISILLLRASTLNFIADKESAPNSNKSLSIPTFVFRISSQIEQNNFCVSVSGSIYVVLLSMISHLYSSSFFLSILPLEVIGIESI